MKLSTIFTGTALGVTLAASGLAQATTVIDSYNYDKTPGYTLPRPPCCIWSLDNIGWYWTPTTDVYLTNIQTKLADVDFGYNNDFDMTVSLFSDRPAVGGTKIDSFTFNASSFIDGNGDYTFPWRGTGFDAPLHLTGGTTYFVGFQGWAAVFVPGVSGGGINWLIDSDGNPPPDAQFLSAAYVNDGFMTEIGTATSVTAAPVIRFVGDFTAPVPEPATYALMLAGLAAVGIGATRRQRL
ncbi:MAG: PEP-CTERM sorting domain-containing protein [Burkholderiales bacterium]